jgi:hypothetical protein
MKKLALLFVLCLGISTAAFAQPVTTQPNVSNLLTQCAANVPVVGNGSGASPICAPGGQIPGVAGNTPASAGNVGQIISACVASGSAVSLTSSQSTTITSISLTAGDWDVSGNISFATAATTSVTLVSAGISGTTNTSPVPPNNTAPFGGGGVSTLRFAAIVPGALSTAYVMPTGSVPVTVASATPVFLDAASVFTVSTLSAYGCIVARRAR